MLASTRRKLSARGVAISRLVPEIPTSALGATATVAPDGVAQHDVAQAQRRAALCVALELRAADFDAIAAAEVLLDRRRQPGREEIEHDRPARRAATKARRRKAAATASDGAADDGGLAHHRMPAVEHEPWIERQPPPGIAQPPSAREPRRSEAILSAHRRAPTPRLPLGCAGAHRAPLPVPGAPRRADCYPCPSCPIGRPLVRRFNDWPFSCHMLLANQFSRRPQRFRTEPRAAATGLQPHAIFSLIR